MPGIRSNVKELPFPSGHWPSPLTGAPELSNASTNGPLFLAPAAMKIAFSPPALTVFGEGGSASRPTDYLVPSVLRRDIIAAQPKVPSKKKTDAGSGTADVGSALMPDNPVLPAAFAMSATK